MKVLSIAAAAMLVALAACRGNSGARDTTGMNSASGSVGASGTGTAGATTGVSGGAMAPGTTPMDTSRRDTTRKQP